jgi:phage tail-like protein
VRTARPLVELLPGVLQEDDFTQRMLAGIDDVLAPVFVYLDALEVYVDPHLCPEDFLPWLAGWVGMLLDENWPVEQQRAFVASAWQVYRYRGTVRGLERELALLTSGEVEIAETGAVTVSTTPSGAIPGEDYPRLSVRVTLPKRSPIADKSVHALVAASKPAHVVHQVEVVRS